MSETAAIPIDLEHLRSWIGRTEEVDDHVTPRLAAMFRATFDPHLAPVEDGGVPWMLHWCLAVPIAPMSDLTDEGHMKKGGFLPPVPLPRRMWAGGAVETRRALRIGKPVQRVSRIGDVSLKEGRSGRLCFVTVHHEYRSGGAVAVSDRQDIVYRDEPTPGAGAPAGAPAKPAAKTAATTAPMTENASADLCWTVEPTPAFLFRYSALMFNAHRIHYDMPYVTLTEGYEGLVVHGPLQASLLFNIAACVLGKPPASFSYRGLSPLIAPQPFSVLARRDGDAVRCWTRNADGVTCMDADARA